MKMNKIKLSARLVPLLLGIVTILSYGLIIPRLGFYWDDWAFAFLSHFYGPAEMVRAFAAYRPFLGPIFFVTTSLFDNIPILWQLFGLLVRFCTGFACWWALTQIWPKHKNQVLAVALIFLVYPGYSQQWVALTHTNQELIPLIAYLFSIGLTARILQHPSTSRWTLILSIVLQIIGLFSTEYFAGYEMIRLGVIFILSDRPSILLRLRTALKVWLPYAVVLAANAVWLFIYYRSGTYHSYSMQGIGVFSEKPLQGLMDILVEAVQTTITASLYAWNQVFNLFRLPAKSDAFLTGLIVLILGLLVVGAFKLLADFSRENEDDNRWTYQAIVLGLIGIWVGRLPSWVAGLPFMVRYDYDRFFLSMMLGASLLTVGVLELIIKSGKTKVILVSLMVALAICTQFLHAKNYQKDAETQKDFYAQWVWRAPSIQPGTTLLTDKIPAIAFESDLGLSAALNWIYTPNLTSHDLPLMLLYTEIRIPSGQLPKLEPDQVFQIEYRTAKFTGNTTDTIVFYYPEVGCVKLVNPDDPIEYNLYPIPLSLKKAALLSNISRIDTGTKSTLWPAEILGKEPKPTWCYYYQQAELAKQKQDWSSVISLAQQAVDGGFRPKDASEWFVFVEAAARSNDMEAAARFMDKYANHRASSKETACRFMQLMDESYPLYTQVQFMADMRSKFVCKQ